MTHGPSELARLRDAGQAGERQPAHDRAVIAALQAELGDHRRETRYRILDILSIMRAIARAARRRRARPPNCIKPGSTADWHRSRIFRGSLPGCRAVASIYIP